MRTEARVFFVLTAAVVGAALVIQLPLTATNEESFFTTPAARMVNLFFFFTILSNLLVAFTSIVLAISPQRRSRAFSAVRLAALVQIVITGVVYRLLLASTNETEGAGAVADTLFHVVVPIMAVVGWLVFGPRGRLDRRVIVWSTLIPLSWLAVTLVRGAILGWYPYPFIDVLEIGYVRAGVNIAGITTAYLALAGGAVWVEARLPRRRAAAATP